MNQNIGKWLIVAGVLLILVGAVYYFVGDKMKWIGNLPGDIRIEKENFKFYFPITTMILFSLVFNVIIKLWRYLN